MARLSLTSVFRSVNPIHTLPRAPLTSTYAQQRRLYAGSNYGGGEGDPKGENPQDQGPNPSADLEHPGPPPPDVGKGTGGGSTQKGSEGHNTEQNSNSGGQAAKSGGSNAGGDGPQPKIHKSEPPEEHTHSDDVKAHNANMEKRHDRATEQNPDEDDRVEKPYWSGEQSMDIWSWMVSNDFQDKVVLIGIHDRLEFATYRDTKKALLVQGDTLGLYDLQTDGTDIAPYFNIYLTCVYIWNCIQWHVKCVPSVEQGFIHDHKVLYEKVTNIIKAINCDILLVYLVSQPASTVPLYYHNHLIEY